MTYIATAALVVIAWRFWVLAEAVIEFIESPPIQNTNVIFNPEIVGLIKNWRRSPRAKKETVA